MVLPIYDNYGGGSYVPSTSTTTTVESTRLAIPSITVLSPNGGEVYNVNSEILIKWSTTNIPSDAQMYVCVQNGILPCTTLSSLNTGFIKYRLSDYSGVNIPGNNFKVMVRMGATTPYVDYSDSTFSIVQETQPANPSVTVLSPNGGETYTAGQQITVKWTAQSFPTGVSVSIAIDPELGGGTIGSFIDVVSTNDGIETFNIPISWNGKYKVFIRTGDIQGYGTIGDFSDNYFTITAPTTDNGCPAGTLYSSTTGQACPVSTVPSIKVLSPNGGEVLVVNQKINPIWIVNNSLVKTAEVSIIDLADSSIYEIGYGDIGFGSKFNHSLIMGKDISKSTSIGKKNFKIVANLLDKNGIGNIIASDVSDDTFTIINSDKQIDIVDNGCGPGALFSNTTGKACALKEIVIDQGCKAGNIFSMTTGKRCAELPMEYVSMQPTTQNMASVSSFVKILRTLKRGVVGEDVKRLQEFLGIYADGVFGRGTEAEVKSWQQISGLYPDGLFGKNSRIKANLEIE